MTMNCNLQRLDGPVRGNSKIVQELEGRFRGAGWNVIKVLWGSSWDDLFSRDSQGILAARLNSLVDGDEQRKAATASKKATEATLKRTVVTPILPKQTFWVAEEYHQDFYKKNPTRYKSYRAGCGRDHRLQQLWGRDAGR